jgi:hypothetical protein
MLKSQYYDETGDPAISRAITGQYIGKAKLDARQRAKLAALWVSRRLEVKPTVKAAVVIFGVCQPYITEELADLKAPARKGKRKAAAKTANGNGKAAVVAKTNGNGHGHGRNGIGGDDIPVIHDHMPFVPDINDLWSHLSDDERASFVRGHAASIWSTIDEITA